MNKDLLVNGFRIILLIFFQVLILKEINLENNSTHYISIIIYQLGIILLPVGLPSFIVLLISFVCGMIVDSFYGSPGVHSSACLWMAASRPFVLKFLEPKSGYSINQKPTPSSLGIFWFLRFASILTFIYLFAYFTMEVFTFVYFGKILLKTLISFTVSMVVIFLIQILINPKE